MRTMEMRKGPPKPHARAILFTDIVGSTRFFASHGDRAGLQMLERHNRALFPIVERANGRIVKTIGDSIFAIFENPDDALRAAFAMQKELADKRHDAPEDSWPHIRVGVHYGLITEIDGDAFGDAVNLAERVKSAADGDEIFISQTLKELVRASPHFVLRSVGARELKGAPEPMQLYQLQDAPHPVRASLWRIWMRRGRRSLRRHRWEVITVALLAIAAGVAGWWKFRQPSEFPKSELAILPFDSLSASGSESDMRRLSLGLTKAITLQLDEHMHRYVHVRPFHPEYYREQELGRTGPDASSAGDSPESKTLAQQLKVGTLVDGQIEVSGPSAMDVHLSIIDPQADEPSWTHQFEGEMQNPAALVKQVMPPLIAEIARRVSPEAARNIERDGTSIQLGTEDDEAYAHYVRALGLQHEITDPSNRLAISELEAAVQRDQNFARAFALLAQAYINRFWWNLDDDPVWLERGAVAAARATALDPNLAEAHVARAAALSGEGKRLDWMRESLAGLKANPDYLPAVIDAARIAFYMGDVDLALRLLDRVGRIDPTINIHARKAQYLFFAGKLRQSAVEQREAEKKEAERASADALILMGQTYAWLGDFAGAERILARLEKLQPNAKAAAEIRAWIAASQGKKGEALAQMQKFPTGPRWGIAQEKAALYAVLGDREDALQGLQRAVEMGAPSFIWYRSEHFRNLRGDPRYESIVKQLSDEYAQLRPELHSVAENALRQK